MDFKYILLNKAIQEENEEEKSIKFIEFEMDSDSKLETSIEEMGASIGIDDLEEMEIQDSVLNNIYYKNNLAHIDSLKKLEDNWNSYKSKAPTELSIQNAQSALSILHELSIQPDKILPTSDNGMLFRINLSSSGYILIEFFDDGHMALLLKTNERRNVRDINIEDLTNIFSEHTHLTD